MHTSFLVREFMQNKPASIAQGTPLAEVIATLRRHKLSGAPVVDTAKRVVGFVSEQDCISQLLNSSYHCSGAPVVDEVMRRDVVSVSGNDSIIDLAEAMNAHRPKVYPVVQDDRLIGLITRSDILQALADNLQICGMTPIKRAV